MESTIINRTKERDEKMKFKVGDKVRVRGDLKNGERYRGTDDSYTVGKIYEFVNGTVVDDDGEVRYKFNPVFNISELQLVRFIPLVE